MSPTENTSERDTCALVSFRIGTQEFCVEIAAVREIRSWSESTPLPHAPEYIHGMINLRGTVLPVVDMGVRLGLPAQQASKRRVIMVVWIGRKLIGLLVDAVCEIFSVPVDALQPAPELAGETIRNLISAVATVDNRMICLVALDHLLPELDMAVA